MQAEQDLCWCLHFDEEDYSAHPKLPPLQPVTNEDQGNPELDDEVLSH